MDALKAPGSWPIVGRVVVATTVAVIPALPGAGGIAFWLLALAGLIMMASRRGRHWAASAELWVAVGLVYAVNCLSVAVFDQRFREAVWFPLLALPMLIPVLRYCRVEMRHLVWSATVGCFCSFIWVLWVGFHADDLRGSLGSNAILFGETTLALVLIVVMGRHVVVRDGALRIRRRGRAYLLNLAALVGVASVMIVGFRGALFALPLFAAALFGIGWPRDARLMLSWLRIIGAVVLVFGVIALVGPKDGLLDRILLMQSEVTSYTSGKVDFSSLGSRLELWEAAIAMFADHPWFGVGVHRFRQELVILQTQGLFPPDVILFKHAHNSYLTIAAEYGVVGLAAFAGFVLVLARGLMQVPCPGAQMGLYLLVLWLILAMTNDIFAHQTAMRALVIVLAICLAAGPRSVSASEATRSLTSASS